MIRELKPQILGLVQDYGQRSVLLLRQASVNPQSPDPDVRRASVIVEQLDAPSRVLLPAMINAYYKRGTVDERA